MLVPRIREKGPKYLAIWLFGGLPIDIVVGVVIVAVVSRLLFYWHPASLTGGLELFFMALCMILFMSYFSLLRDRVIRLYLRSWLK